MCFGVREWSCTRPNFLFVCFQCDMCVWERGACVTGQACDCTREPQESYVYDVARGSYIGVLRQGACFLSCDVEVRYLFPLCGAQGAGEEGGDAVAQGSVEDLVEVPLLGFPMGRVVKGPPGRGNCKAHVEGAFLEAQLSSVELACAAGVRGGSALFRGGAGGAHARACVASESSSQFCALPSSQGHAVGSCPVLEATSQGGSRGCLDDASLKKVASVDVFVEPFVGTVQGGNAKVVVVECEGGTRGLVRGKELVEASAKAAVACLQGHVQDLCRVHFHAPGVVFSVPGQDIFNDDEGRGVGVDEVQTPLQQVVRKGSVDRTVRGQGLRAGLARG